MAISNDSRTRIRKVFEPIALGMGRLGLTPDALTLIGFAITVVGAVLISQQLWIAGGVVILVGGVFDMFDGALARATGKVSNLGGFMDSVFDRAGEAIVYVGIVVACTIAGFGDGAIYAAAAMAAAFMVSYTRAKSEGLGFTPGTGMAAIGIMPREVRLVLLCAALILVGLTGGIVYDTTGICGFDPSCDTDAGSPWSIGIYILGSALALIFVGATITTIQRILYVRSEAKKRPTETK